MCQVCTESTQLSVAFDLDTHAEPILHAEMDTCPRDRLLNTTNDIELISKELFEYFLANKHTRQSLIDGNQLSELLVKKDYELKREIANAHDQEVIQSKIEILRSEVEKYDEELRQLQKNLKEAEHILATGIYQAKQKLSLIQKANSHPISTEELIKYAHKISSDHSVASPYNWEIGDQRRPYPTDLEMKSGLLANSNDANLSSLLQQQQNQYVQQSQIQQEQQPIARPASSASASSSPYPWANQFDIKPNINALNSSFDSHHEVKANNKDNDDVEVMSTDSSSSSSSDSQ